MTLSDDGSGIRWMVINQTLSCLVDNANLAFDSYATLVEYHEFIFDRVIPFVEILNGPREKCTISVMCPLRNNFTYKLMCPTQIWQAMSKKIYTNLTLKIPHELRRFHQSVDKNDGEALVKSIRTTCDNVSQTTAQLLELRKGSNRLFVY